MITRVASQFMGKRYLYKQCTDVLSLRVGDGSDVRGLLFGHGEDLRLDGTV